MAITREDYNIPFIIPNETEKYFVLELSNEPIQKKLDFLDKYCLENECKFNPEVFDIKRNWQYGLVYYAAENYKKAIFYFEKAQDKSSYEFDDFYFWLLQLLSRCYRFLKKESDSLYWLIKYSEIPDEPKWIFERMRFLTEYVKHIEFFSRDFDSRYKPLIKSVKNDIGFVYTETFLSPTDEIKHIENIHRKWNRAYSLLIIASHDDKKLSVEDKYQDFIDNCKVEWYKKEAMKRLKEYRKGKSV